MRLVSEGVNDMEDRGFKVRPEIAREAVAYVFGATEAVGSPDKIIYNRAKVKHITDRVEEILKKGLAKKNPASRKENYSDFDEWETDVFRAGATQVIRLGEDLFSAIKMRDGSLVKLDEEGFVDMRSRAGQKVRRESVTVGAWYGDRGEIYRQTIKNNPVTRRKGESIRDFTSRCMSEEKTSSPEPKQRIAVCLSKSRKRNPVYDTGSDE
jgi:hypothetical protein